MKFLTHIFIIGALAFASCSSLQAQSNKQEQDKAQEQIDIDEWQVLKAEVKKDPFEKSNQFSINFKKYLEGDWANQWAYPLPGAHVISPFGGARHHAGTDVKRNPNDTIRAAFAGEVVLSGVHYGYGNCVILRHANGLETLYSHNSKNLVKVGQWVTAGQPLALEGRTGRATTEHLHFETRVNGKAFNSELIWDHNANKLRPVKFTATKQSNGAIKFSVEK